MGIKKSRDAAHKSRWRIFEIVFGLPSLVAILLQLAAPLSFPRGLFMLAIIPGGVALIIVGAVLVVLGRRELALRGQPTDPGFSTNELVTTGVYSFSRNPLYLGGICFLEGIALAINLPWLLLILLPAIIVGSYVLIVPEERYLAAKFGEKYHAYAATVHRWIGRDQIV